MSYPHLLKRSQSLRLHGITLFDGLPLTPKVLTELFEEVPSQ